MACRAVPLGKESLGWKGVSCYRSPGGIKTVGALPGEPESLNHPKPVCAPLGDGEEGPELSSDLRSVSGPQMSTSC